MSAIEKHIIYAFFTVLSFIFATAAADNNELPMGIYFQSEYVIENYDNPDSAAMMRDQVGLNFVNPTYATYNEAIINLLLQFNEFGIKCVPIAREPYNYFSNASYFTVNANDATSDVRFIHKYTGVGAEINPDNLLGCHRKPIYIFNQPLGRINNLV